MNCREDEGTEKVMYVDENGKKYVETVSIKDTVSTLLHKVCTLILI